MTKIIIGVIVIVIAVWAFMTYTSVAPEEDKLVKDEKIAMSANVSLSPQNDSGEEGTASLSEVDGKVKVMLSVTGAPQGHNQPVHVHEGTCADLKGVKYPLTNIVNGVSETMLDVSWDDFASGLPFAINAHKSADELGVYVSCGDIAL